MAINATTIIVDYPLALLSPSTYSSLKFTYISSSNAQEHMFCAKEMLLNLRQDKKLFKEVQKENPKFLLDLFKMIEVQEATGAGLIRIVK